MRHYTIASPHVISEQASGETVVINLDTGSYFNLNAEASKLWALLVAGADLDALAATVSEPQKLEDFLARLISEGLLKPADAVTALPADLKLDAAALALEVYTDMQALLGLDPIHEAEGSWPVAPAA